MKKLLSGVGIALVLFCLGTLLAGNYMLRYGITPDPHGLEDLERTRFKADTLMQKEKFAEAKELLGKLKFSKLRKDAVEKYNKLADIFCTKQRTVTSQLFGKAQKQKDAAKKKKLLQDAIAPLDKCLTEYPDNPQKQKVLDNKKFLESEIAK